MVRQIERRTHTKSRKGCLQCKKRHVKCNESRPQCGRCERLEIDCTWPVKKPVQASKEEDAASCPPVKEVVTTTVSPSRSSANTAITAPPDFLDVENLKLLHYWYLNTSLTCAQAGQQHIWQTSVPELGFRHHFLLRGLLATAAIHKATIHPDEAEELLLQSSRHMDIALATFRDHLSRPDPATCIPVFALACLLVMHRLGLAQVQTPTDPIEELCILARLSRGIKPTVSIYWDRILSSEMGPVVRGVTERKSAAAESSFPEVHHLADLINENTSLDETYKKNCLSALEDLHSTFATIPGPTGDVAQAFIGRIFSWTANLSDGFLEGLEGKEGVAIAVLGEFARLLRGTGEGVWYMRGWAGWILGEVERGFGEGEGGWEVGEGGYSMQLRRLRC
ncbi:hypothetical protein M409DRAFT_29796 [Zasmidium cellare ATCC 36951]|uniref:Zn(2)-C6 fungal-type domain-containing protein n=1 Tax=Zasmidium cellare ATCC 36951 TaxID=1080233 RepID=A0A6A6BYC0_ZASCE|nr:uncharacterized protein M409DRAFT_29796 [Zasmidium cellare ATCC 36951]KAF2159797.1 hypothetical protein M409DRAFT_29796 [Zasmidium cellare ATCC 36951]